MASSLAASLCLAPKATLPLFSHLSCSRLALPPLPIQTSTSKNVRRFRDQRVLNPDGRVKPYDPIKASARRHLLDDSKRHDQYGKFVFLGCVEEVLPPSGKR